MSNQSINAIKFLRDHNIPYTTSGSKHCRAGWVQIGCSFCAGGVGTHLGICLPGAYASCWRCKGKSMLQVVQSLLTCSWGEAHGLVEQYSVKGSTTGKRGKSTLRKIKLLDKEVKLPPGTTDLTPRHDEYLAKRGFDPEYLERMFELNGVGPIGGYKHRIIAPIALQGRIVSYQGRDITGKSDLKYKACAEIDEAYPHKHTLYGIDLAKKESVVVVEGITDVWRLGPGAVATFGTSFTSAQVKMIHTGFKRAFVLFDGELAAQKAAQELGHMLAVAGVDVEVLLLGEGDPGGMVQDEADGLARELLVN